MTYLPEGAVVFSSQYDGQRSAHLLRVNTGCYINLSDDKSTFLHVLSCCSLIEETDTKTNMEVEAQRFADEWASGNWSYVYAAQGILIAFPQYI